jgi:hypothetical protein
MSGLSDMWIYDSPWVETPFWLRWLGKPKWRRHRPQDHISGSAPYWLYLDQLPSPGGIDRSSAPYWKTRVYEE